MLLAEELFQVRHPHRPDFIVLAEVVLRVVIHIFYFPGYQFSPPFLKTVLNEYEMVCGPLGAAICQCYWVRNT